MVDCGGLRCAQERRSFKKELLSWAKKIPVLIGLEAVALEIGGHELVSQLLEPFSCLETDEITDWEPEENCFYCNTKITDPGSELNEDGTKKIHSGFKCTPELMPYCPQYYTQNAQMDSSQQPLDLSSNGCLDSVPSPGSAWELDLVSKPHVELKIPQITMQAGKCKKDTHIQNGKKAYTEEELVTAVTEIRSGKLGTRRAAVLYGIPRSTLRNKIFKMETEEQQQSAVVINTEHECSEDSQHSDGAISHLQRAIMAGASDPLHLSPYSMLFPPLVGGILSCQQDFGPQTEDDWEKRLEQIRRKHNLNGAAINLAEKPLPLTANNGKNSNSTCPEFKLPLLHDLVRKMTEQRLLIEQSASQIRSPVALESLRHQQEGINHHSNGISSSSSSNQPTDSPSSYTLMSLKIPSYRPAKAQNQPETVNSTTLAPSSNDMTEERPYDSMKIGEALKDIIVKTISEKVYKRKHQADSYSSTQDENHPGNNNNNCKSYSSDLMATGSAMPPAKKLKKSGGEKKLENNNTTNNTITNNNNNNNNMDGGNKPVKKTRPKRGQYRKYNSQLLMEAVRAVQRGEMSVHRAGSYYGVPHSTLEYKVKERHLLRQKKIKESQIQKDSSNTGSSSSGVSLEDSGGTKTASHTSGSATSSRGSSGNNGNNNKNNNNNSSNNNNNNNNNTNNNNNNNSKNNNSNNNTTNNNSSSKSNVVSASSSSSSSSTNSGNVKSEKSSSASNAGNGKNTGSKFECKSLNSPWLQPYTNGSPQYDASGMNLFTSSFALSTPASELLRKLQHKVQSKSNAFAQDSNFLSGALNRQNGMSPLGNSFLFIN